MYFLLKYIFYIKSYYILKFYKKLRIEKADVVVQIGGVFYAFILHKTQTKKIDGDQIFYKLCKFLTKVNYLTLLEMLLLFVICYYFEGRVMLILCYKGHMSSSYI